MASGLCDACRALDFETLRCPSLLEVNQPSSDAAPRSNILAGHRQKSFPLGLVSTVRERSYSCRLCFLVLKVLTSRSIFTSVQEAKTECCFSNGYYGVYVLSNEEKRFLCRLSIFTTEVGQEQDWTGSHARHCFQACSVGTADVSGNKEAQLLEESQPPQCETLFSGRLRPLDLNVLWLRHWLDICQGQHGSSCQPSEDEERVAYIRFVDVDAKAIVRLDNVHLSSIRYLALSYVWGKQKQRLMLTWENLEELCKPGVLSADSVSTTIGDAIELARRMSFRYIWIDGLCIIQNSNEDKQVQISAMGRIYNSADVTVVAASGDNADAGLPGLRPGTRHTVQEEVMVLPPSGGTPGLSLLTTLDPKGGPNAHHAADTMWDSRGWTFQERHLARRVLTFTKEQVYFSCNRDTFCEESYFEHGVRLCPYEQASFDLSLGLERQHSEPLDEKERLWIRYRLAVVRFTQRELGQSGDVYNAFAGIEQNMLRIHGERFRWGLPQSRFNEALAWSTFYGLRRREDLSTLPMTNLNCKVRSPSWSWMGWFGEAYVSVTNERYELGEIAIVNAHIHQITDSKIELSPASNDDEADTTLQHEIIRTESPSREILADTPSGHLLFFWAERAFFWCSKEGSRNIAAARYTLARPSSDKTPTRNATIRDAKNSVVGSVGPMQASHWAKGRDSERREFVAIGRRQIMHFDCEAYVTVLQVQWEDGIAYRVNIGEIAEKAWSAAKLERVVMVLG